MMAEPKGLVGKGMLYRNYHDCLYGASLVFCSWIAFLCQGTTFSYGETTTYMEFKRKAKPFSRSRGLLLAW